MSMSTEYLALLSEPPSVSRRVVLEAASPTPISRRAVLRTAFALGAAALAASAVGRASASAQAVTQYRTTAALNFRSGPSLSHSVIAVIPAGTIVAHTGASKNGFYEVGFNGTYGWSHSDYLGPVGGQTPPPDGGLGGNGRTTATVNFREGPSLSARVIAVLPAGTPLVVHDEGASGFWSVAYNGQSGYIWADYVERTGGGTPPPSGPAYDPNYATTTAALNLRADASLSAKVLTVMPSGTRVKVLDGYANGFRKVSYNGVTGWAHTSYLN